MVPSCRLGFKELEEKKWPVETSIGASGVTEPTYSQGAAARLEWLGRRYASMLLGRVSPAQGLSRIL